MKKLFILFVVLLVLGAGNAMAWDHYMEVVANTLNYNVWDEDHWYGYGDFCYMQVEVEYLYAMPEDAWYGEVGGYANMHTENAPDDHTIIVELPYNNSTIVSEDDYFDVAGNYPYFYPSCDLHAYVFAHADPVASYPYNLCQIRSAAMCYWVG